MNFSSYTGLDDVLHLLNLLTFSVGEVLTAMVVDVQFFKEHVFDFEKFRKTQPERFGENI